MKATRVFKSFDEMSREEYARLSKPAAQPDSSAPDQQPAERGEASRLAPADERDFSRVQPYRHWGINE